MKRWNDLRSVRYADAAFGVQQPQTFGEAPLSPAPKPSGNPMRGQKVTFQRNSLNQLVTGQWQTLLRETSVGSKQVVLTPVFRNAVGPFSQGMPVVAGNTGAPRMRITWGSGGVTFRFEGSYPVAGATFTVAGDELAVDVSANDGVTVFADPDVPAVAGWVQPTAAPQTPTPLYQGYGDAALIGPFTISAWTRAIHVYDSTGAAIAVVFTGPLGTQTIMVASGTRVPVPAGALRFSIPGGAGTVAATEEISFA